MYKRNKKHGVATKVMVMILSLVLVAGLSIGGTLAWLTAKTNAVTNTFTVGDININLWEYGYSAKYNSQTEEKVTSVDTYKIVPGTTSPKTPHLTVEAKSEECYVYVTVENNLVIDEGDVATAVATVNIQDDTWISVETDGNKTLYRYKETVEYSGEDQDLPVFTQVTYSDKITKDNISQLSGKTIELYGYAHQASGTDQATADAAAIAWAFPAA